MYTGKGGLTYGEIRELNIAVCRKYHIKAYRYYRCCIMSGILTVLLCILGNMIYDSLPALSYLYTNIYEKESMVDSAGAKYMFWSGTICTVYVLCIFLYVVYLFFRNVIFEIIAFVISYCTLYPIYQEMSDIDVEYINKSIYKRKESNK